MTKPTFGSTTQFPAGAGAAPDAAVLLLPALATPVHAYKRVISALNSANIHAAFMHYGTQQSIAAGPRSGRSRTGFSYLADTAVPLALQQLASSHPDRPLWVFGHSLGAQVAVLAVKRGSIEPDGLYFAAGGTPHYRCFSGLTKLTVLAGTALPCAVSLALGRWPGRSLRIGVDESADLVKDWTTLAWTGNYGRLTSNGETPPGPWPSHTYDRPLIAGVFDDDNLAPRDAVETLCQHLPHAQLSIVGLGAGGHMDWLKHPSTAVLELTRRIGSPRT